MKTSVKGRYELDKSHAAATFSVNAGQLKLKASMTDATVSNGPSMEGLVLSVEKPGFFIIDYNIPRKDVRFQFMNSLKVADKPVNLTYIHARADNRTILDGSFVLDSANKVSANYLVGSRNCKLKYTYIHGERSRTFEPCYDLAKNTWDFSISQRIYEDDVVRASYQTLSKVLTLDWTRETKVNGSFKISASLNLADVRTTPKLCAESTWNFEI